MIAHVALWRWIVLLLALAPLYFYIVAIIAALRFFQRERAKRSANFALPSVF